MEFSEDKSVGNWRNFNLSPKKVKKIRKSAYEFRNRKKKRITGNIHARRSHVHYIKSLGRRLISRARAGKKYERTFDREVLHARFKKSRILNGFLSDRDKKWKLVPDRTGRNISDEIKLKDFSFFENPIETMKVFNRIAIAECRCVDLRLDFVDYYCLDIGAYLLLAACNKDMVPITSGGKISTPVAKVLDAVLLREQLGMAKMSIKNPNKDIWAFTVQSRHKADTSQSQTRHLDLPRREKVATDLIEAINQWLDHTTKQSLTLSGRRMIVKIIGEVLDNAERHSSEYGDGDWSIVGFMAHRKNAKNESIYRCHLAFLSIGKSISQSMTKADPAVLRNMRTYTARHSTGLKKRHFSREHLETVFALQDGVTCVPKAIEDKRGGTGFQEILEFFKGLSHSENGKDDAQLAIISGNTCIFAKGPYMVGKRQSGDERELWFNTENSPNQEPDGEYIIKLPHYLNGTLVTMAFNLDTKDRRKSYDLL